jgi:CBS domain containing-hemolysin-like protein
MAALLASASAAVSLAAPLEDHLAFTGRAAQPLSVVLVTLLLAYAMLVLGELAPKRVGLQKAERWGLLDARPIAAMARLTRPVVWLLSKSTNLAVRLMGGDPHANREQVTAEELRDLVAAQASFTSQQRRIIDGAFEISERSLHEVLRPRPDVLTIDAGSSCDSARDTLVASGHSRAPIVTGGSLDDVTGIVHLRDLINDEQQACTAGKRPCAEHGEVRGLGEHTVSAFGDGVTRQGVDEQGDRVHDRGESWHPSQGPRDPDLRRCRREFVGERHGEPAFLRWLRCRPPRRTRATDDRA